MIKLGQFSLFCKKKKLCSDPSSEPPIEAVQVGGSQHKVDPI